MIKSLTMDILVIGYGPKKLEEKVWFRSVSDIRRIWKRILGLIYEKLADFRYNLVKFGKLNLPVGPSMTPAANNFLKAVVSSLDLFLT